MGTKRTEQSNRNRAKFYDSIQVLVRKDATYDKENLKKIAADRGMSLNELFITAVIKYIEEN